MTASQRFGRFAIPFRITLLFSPRMARVTAAEASTTEGKRCPRSFDLWNKSKSGWLMSGLYGAWGNTCHSSLLNKSVTNFPKSRCALSYKMSDPFPSKSYRFLCNFLRNFCFQSRTIRCCHTCSTCNSYPSWWFLGDYNQKSSFAGTLIALVEIFWVARIFDFSTRLTAIPNSGLTLYRRSADRFI